MDNFFSSELKDLVSRSRDTAIDLGYDYISTIHFFIADCENDQQNSIFRFAFSNEKEFEKFKADYTLEKKDLLGLFNESLPLTMEAEKTLRLTESQRVLHQQKLSYPCHFFLAALKNQDSLLSGCFKHDVNALDNLIKYYEGKGDFEKSKMKTEQISKEYDEPDESVRTSFVKRLKKMFSGRK